MRIVAGVAGAAVGFYLGGGPTGAALGWSIGYGIGTYLDTPDVPGPDPGDLAAPKVSLGSRIPRIYGTVRVPLNPIYVSPYTAYIGGGDGGKGGSDAPEAQTINYRLDIMGLMADGTNVVGWIRAWGDKKLVASRDVRSDAATLAALAQTPAWHDIRLYNGAAGQAPDPTYEDAVNLADGDNNAVANLGVCTLMLVQADSGQYKSPKLWEFELTTNATAGQGDVYWLLNPDGTDGQTTFVDTSSWRHDVASTTYTQQAPGLYGPGAAHSSTGGPRLRSVVDVPATAQEGHTLEGRFMLGASARASGGIGFLQAEIGGMLQVSMSVDVSPVLSRLTLEAFGQSVSTVPLGPDELGVVTLPLPIGVSMHMAVTWDPSIRRATWWIDGSPTLVLDYVGDLPAVTSVGSAAAGSLSELPAGALTVDGVRFTRRRVRYSAPFTPPSVAPIDDGGSALTPLPVDLADVVRAEMLRHPDIDESMFDVTELEGIMLRGVTCVGDLASVLADLAQTYKFTLTPRMVFKRPGATPAASVPFHSGGASLDDPGTPFTGLASASDDEVPMVPALAYPNYLQDYEAGYEAADRLEGEAPHHRKITTSVVMTPSEAATAIKQMAQLMRLSANTAQVSVDGRYLACEPGDVLLVADDAGHVYRVAITRENVADGVRAYNVELDDPGVLDLTAIADETIYVPSVTVALRADTTLVALDIPMLRAADNDPGPYLAVEAAAAGNWPGATVQRSIDGVVYTTASLHNYQSIIGYAQGALPDWTGGQVWDNTSALLVDVGPGQTLASSTREAMAATEAINVAAIGVHGRWEVVRYRSATLVSGTIYRLSGFLRGQLGTEAHIGTHAAGDRFVFIDSSIQRAPPDAIGVQRWLRAVTLGAVASQAAATTFTNTAQSLAPYAPTSLRVDRTAADWVLRVFPRSRMHPYFAPGGLVVPPDPNEAGFDFDVYADAGFSVFLRTLAAPAGTAAVTYTAAQRAADGVSGLLHARVAGKSTIVGRGADLKATA
jgi:hypothetical protein